MLENLDLRLDGTLPEFAIQIAPTPIVPRAVLETGWVADRINVQEKTLGNLRLERYRLQEFCRSQRPGWFVPVNGAKNPDANRIGAVRAEKSKTRERVRSATH